MNETTNSTPENLEEAIERYEKTIGEYGAEWFHGPEITDTSDEALAEIEREWTAIRPTIEAAATAGDERAQTAIEEGDGQAAAATAQRERNAEATE